MNGGHANYDRVKWKAYRRRQRHRNKGLCLECTRRAVPNRCFCVFHLMKARRKARKEYEWRVSNGICVKCGIPIEEARKGVNCVSCARKAAEKERLRRTANRIAIRLLPIIGEGEGSNLAPSCPADGGGLNERKIA